MFSFIKKIVISFTIFTLVAPMLGALLIAPQTASAQEVTITDRVKGTLVGFALGGVSGATVGATAGAPSVAKVAGAAGETILSGLTKFIGLIVSLWQMVFGYLVNLLANSIVLVIQLGTETLSLTTIQVGFNVSLSFVNLIFVMALIIIAFQIILDYHAGDAKEKLVKVIMGAVLVNFSLLVAGFLLDISNVFTIFFLKGVTSDGIRNALNPEIFITIGKSMASSGSFGDLAVLVGQIFGLLFTGIVLIILLAVFATALVRLLWVICLLIVMPLTWAFWVFPGLSKYTGQWWDNFIKWGVVMLPTMTFFLYVALQSTKSTSELLGSRGGEAGFLGGVLQLLILGGLMVAGLKIANGAGGITSTAALGAAKRIAGGAAALGYNRWTKPGFQKLGGKISSGLTNMAGNSNNRFLRTVGKIGVLGGAAEAGAKFAHGREHDLEEQAKARYGSMSKEQLAQLATTATFKDEKVKILMMLAKTKGGIKALAEKKGGPEKLKELADLYSEVTHKEDASDLEGVKEVVMANPTLAPQFYKNTSVSQFIKKYGISKEAKADVLENTEVLEAIASSKTLQRQVTLNNSDAFNTELGSKLDEIIKKAGPEMDAVNKLEEQMTGLDRSIDEATKTGQTGRVAGPTGLLMQRRDLEKQLTTAKKDLNKSSAGRTAATAKDAVNYINQIQSKI